MNTNKLLFELLPIFIAICIVAYTSFALRKRTRKRDRSEWKRIFEAAQQARQRDSQILRIPEIGLSANVLDVHAQSDMPKLKLS